MTEEEFDSVIRVHLKGTFNTTHFAGGYWQTESKEGRKRRAAIVNTVSSAGPAGQPRPGQLRRGQGRHRRAHRRSPRSSWAASACAPTPSRPAARPAWSPRRCRRSRSTEADEVERGRVQPPQPRQLGADGGVARVRRGDARDRPGVPRRRRLDHALHRRGRSAPRSRRRRARASGIPPRSATRSTRRSSTAAPAASRWAAEWPATSGSPSSARRCPTAGASTPSRRSSCTSRPRRARSPTPGSPRTTSTASGRPARARSRRSRSPSTCGLRPDVGRRHRRRRQHVGVHGRARGRGDPGRPRRGRRARVRLDDPRRPQGAAPRAPTSASARAVRCSSTCRTVTR